MWRGAAYDGPASPEPFPSRVDAFLTACAMTAGHREDDVRKLVEGMSSLGRALEPIAKMAGR